MNKDNAAGRLYDVLQRMLNTSTRGRCVEVLAVFFELAPTIGSLQGDNLFPVVPKVTHSLTEILKLTDETERELNAIEDLNKALFSNTFSHIRKSISTYILNPVGDWGPYLGELQRIDFRGLEFASDILSRFSVEQVIPSSTLEAFLHEVDQFYEEVLSSEIHWEAKHFILDRLDEIRDAIREYHIRGVKGLSDCLGKTIGLVYLNPHLFETPPDEAPEKSKFKTRFLNLVTRLTTLLSLGSKALRLGEQGMPVAEFVWKIVKGHLGAGDPPAE